MFNLFKTEKFKKTTEITIFVCKHCKLTCKDCESTFCYSCFVNEKNPCPRCGKRNCDEVEK